MPTPQLGLRENWRQFSLLILINAFVGGMVGLERSILPRLAKQVCLGIGLAVLGLLGSLLVRDTRAHVALETAQAPAGPAEPHLSFWYVTWRHPNLGSVTQAGFVNNLTTGWCGACGRCWPARASP